jgi:hypothetical protein
MPQREQMPSNLILHSVVGTGAVLPVRQRFVAGHAVVLGHRHRDLEIALLLRPSDEPRQALAAEHFQTELGRVSLPDVVDDIYVEVRGLARASLTCGTSSGRNQPR